MDLLNRKNILVLWFYTKGLFSRPDPLKYWPGHLFFYSNESFIDQTIKFGIYINQKYLLLKQQQQEKFPLSFLWSKSHLLLFNLIFLFYSSFFLLKILFFFFSVYYLISYCCQVRNKKTHMITYHIYIH